MRMTHHLAGLLCAIAIGGAARAEPPGLEVLQDGPELVLWYGPRHASPEALAPALASLCEAIARERGLILRVAADRRAAVTALLDRLDRPPDEAVLVIAFEELRAPLSDDPPTVLARRAVTVRVARGRPAEVELAVLPAFDDEQQLRLELLRLDETSARIAMQFDLRWPAEGGPGEGERTVRSAWRRRGAFEARVPTSRADVVLELELDTEQGQRRLFRVVARALAGSAADPAPRWSERVRVLQVWLDSPPYADLELDGLRYRVQAGTRLGDLEVVGVGRDVTFRHGTEQFSLLPPAR